MASSSRATRGKRVREEPAFNQQLFRDAEAAAKYNELQDRNIFSMRCINFVNLASNGYDFTDNIRTQGFVRFFQLKGPYTPDAVRLFCANLRCNYGTYSTWINGHLITLTENDFRDAFGAHNTARISASRGVIFEDFIHKYGLVEAGVDPNTIIFASPNLSKVERGKFMNLKPRMKVLERIVRYTLSCKKGAGSELTEFHKCMIFCIDQGHAINLKETVCSNLLQVVNSSIPDIKYGRAITYLCKHFGMNMDNMYTEAGLSVFGFNEVKVILERSRPQGGAQQLPPGGGDEEEEEEAAEAGEAQAAGGAAPQPNAMDWAPYQEFTQQQFQQMQAFQLQQFQQATQFQQDQFQQIHDFNQQQFHQVHDEFGAYRTQVDERFAQVQSGMDQITAGIGQLRMDVGTLQQSFDQSAIQSASDYLSLNETMQDFIGEWRRHYGGPGPSSS